ncbi:hypothetical protein EXIGLDRAFT_779094 [Exidia glandulosa HHB12029]|uniref:Uncharacterized protein n=1 Tax=Exidia glandulosa HHB12029 TaxID=1314781 RepID=A0A165C7Y7_EXIGL|nr:hypothetical protein EXIGLDRAFT_779094 [Exidia glandulosa HHB12029]
MSRSTVALSSLIQQAASLGGKESQDWPALTFLQWLLVQPDILLWLQRAEWNYFQYTDTSLGAARDYDKTDQASAGAAPPGQVLSEAAAAPDFPLDPLLAQADYAAVHGVATSVQGGTTEVQAVLPHVHLGLGVAHSASRPMPGATAAAVDGAGAGCGADADGIDVDMDGIDMDSDADGADADAHATEDLAQTATASAGMSASTGTGASTGASGHGTGAPVRGTGASGRGSGSKSSGRQGKRQRPVDDDDYVPRSEERERGRPAKRVQIGERRNSKKGKKLKTSGVPANAENVGEREIRHAEEEERAMEEEDDTPNFTANTLVGRPEHAIAALSQISDPFYLSEADTLIKLLAGPSELHTWTDPLGGSEETSLQRLLSVYHSAVQTTAQGYRARFEGMLCDIAFAVGTSRVKQLTQPEKEIFAGNAARFLDGSWEDPYASQRKHKSFDALYRALFAQELARSGQVLEEDSRRTTESKFVGKCKTLRTRGLKWAHLAMAGGIQILLFIAVVKQATLFQDIVRDDYTKLGHFLRDPHLFQGSPTAMHRALWQIIPGLLELGKSVNIHFDGRTFGKDLDADDSYWGRELVFNTFALPPRCKEWEGARLWPASQTTLLQGPVSLRRPLSPVWEVSSAPTRVIKTQFDLHDSRHERPSFAQGESKSEWTRKCRDFIGQERADGRAVICKTFEELEVALTYAYKDGSIYKGPHIHVLSSVAKGFDVLVLDKNGNIMLFIVDEDALMKYSRIVYNNCSAIVPDNEEVDASNFYAMHYSVTNAYSKSGKQYPKLPSAYQIPDKSNQRIPHPNAELMHDVFTSDVVASCLAPVFALLTERIRTNLPDVYNKLVEYEECLPLGALSPASPFAGFVVNIAPATIIHRNRDLSDLCMDYTYGDFTGGELVLHQARLVVQFKAGTGGGFASYALDHFNLDYIGSRASAILHTERCSNSWYLRRNDWVPNMM